jgi:hypothetical protein
MANALQLIPAPTKLITVSGAGHDLQKGKFDLATLVEECRHLGSESTR